MKSFFRFTFIFVAAAFLLSSCSKKNEEGKMIPKNAMFVVQLDTKSLKEKLTWDDIKQSYWYGQLYTHLQESNGAPAAQVKQILDNPDKTGIDLNGSLIFFVAKNSGSESELVLEGSIKNGDDFAAFNKTLDSSATVKKDGELNMITLHDEAVVAWNDKHFVYAFDASEAKIRFNPMNNGAYNQSNV
ncbi:MAG: DUF4836 family protein, partial [Ginsengibacter sp.]